MIFNWSYKTSFQNGVYKQIPMVFDFYKTKRLDLVIFLRYRK